MKKIIFILLLLFTTKMHAILPPLYQSLKEIKSIVNDERFEEMLDSSEMILKIEKTNTGYSVITNKSVLDVRVIYIPRGYPGPAQYKLEFYKEEKRD